eukprot:SAG11_NODE_13132_length_668_cov_1.623902_2_plen_65_part_01
MGQVRQRFNHDEKHPATGTAPSARPLAAAARVPACLLPPSASRIRFEWRLHRLVTLELIPSTRQT